MPSYTSADSIRSELNRYLDECEKHGREPVAEPHEWYALMAEHLGMSYTGLRRWDAESAQVKFQHQVFTQLNNADKAGRLVKRRRYQGVVFITPGKAAQLDKAEDAQEQAAEQERQRALTIRLRLEKLGVFPPAGDSIRLTLDDWHKLVTLAENGTALRREG
jgi:hypothetical protein